MLEPPKPADEATRLAALKSLQVIDTPDEERFDRITRLAARLLDVPIAVISLVDSDRQWFKSKYGLDASEPPRDVSFCGHAILHDEPRVVTDATLAPRFADNPLVAAEPCIRFYAGHPLEAVGGSKLGTLCLIDHQPRQLSEAGRQCLHEICPVGHPPLNAFLGIPLYSGGTLVFFAPEGDLDVPSGFAKNGDTVGRCFPGAARHG